MTHKHYRFGFGLCGAKPPFSTVVTMQRLVDCPACLAKIARKRAGAKRELAKVVGEPGDSQG